MRLPAVLLAACAACATAPAVPAPKAGGPVKVELYVMSQCPYGVDAVNRFKAVADTLGKDLDLSLEFVGSIGLGGSLSSLHGPDEVRGDTAQLCARHLSPQKYLELVACQNRDPRAVASNWEGCARETGLPVEELRACLDGPEGRELLTASFQKAEARHARSSPTILIAGQPYQGRRTAGALLRAVCTAGGGALASCRDVPPASAVTVGWLTDSRCASCPPASATERLPIENPKLRVLDVALPEGKAAYESLGEPAPRLPMLLFDASLDSDAELAQMLASKLERRGAWRALDVGGSWDPACADAGGCALERCRDTLACRAEAPATLELFVMSQCPYGVRALEAMDEVLAAFGDKMDFRLHFIGAARDGELASMHGPAEVEEDLRELCAMRRYPEHRRWLDYVRCRNQDIRSDDWKRCATGGIDASALEECASGEGRRQLADDFRLAEGLGISASPTFIANGRSSFHGIDAQTIREGFCQKNPGLAACARKAGSPSDAAPSGCDK